MAIQSVICQRFSRLISKLALYIARVSINNKDKTVYYNYNQDYIIKMSSKFCQHNRQCIEYKSQLFPLTLFFIILQYTDYYHSIMIFCSDPDGPWTIETPLQFSYKHLCSVHVLFNLLLFGLFVYFDCFLLLVLYYCFK